MKHESDHNNINHLRNNSGNLLDKFEEGKMMTLDEAIKHAEEKAAELREYSDVLSETSTTPKGKEISDCLECAEEHEQLAEWLIELKAYKVCPLMENECYLCRADKCHNGGQKNETD